MREITARFTSRIPAGSLITANRCSTPPVRGLSEPHELIAVAVDGREIALDRELVSTGAAGSTGLSGIERPRCSQTIEGSLRFLAHQLVAALRLEAPQRLDGRVFRDPPETLGDGDVRSGLATYAGPRARAALASAPSPHD